MKLLDGKVSRVDRTGKILAELLDEEKLYEVLPTSEGYLIHGVCNGNKMFLAHTFGQTTEKILVLLSERWQSANFHSTMSIK